VAFLGPLMDSDRPLREGERVELLPGAPVPQHQYYIKPGAQGRVVITDEGLDEDTGWVTVLFGNSGRPIRVHRRWLRRVGPGRSSRSRHD
jgi:hypothetical protein